MAVEFPEFGLYIEDAVYVLRPGGYAVVFNQAGEVAVVSTPKGLYLPGGGQSAAESAEDAALRETLEECCLRIRLSASIGVADELVFDEDERKYYRKRCAFFLAEVVGRAEEECSPDHELAWLAPEDATVQLSHQSQRWAVTLASRMTKRAGEG